MYVNGAQQQLKRGPAKGWLATLLDDLRQSMERAGGSLAICFDSNSEIMELAGMLGLGQVPECEGAFPTLTSKILPGLDFSYYEAERALSIWQSRR